MFVLRQLKLFKLKAPKENRVDPYWKGWTISRKICFNLTNNYKNHFQKESFSRGKGLLLYSNNWCCLFLMSFWIRSVLIRDWPSIFPQPRKLYTSVKRTLSDIYNCIQLNKNRTSEATFLSRRKTGELTCRLPRLCSSTRTGAVSPHTSSSWGLEGLVAVRTLVRLLRSHSGGFSWWGHGAECMHVGGSWLWTELPLNHPLFWMKESKGEKQERYETELLHFNEWNLNNGEKETPKCLLVLHDRDPWPSCLCWASAKSPLSSGFLPRSLPPQDLQWKLLYLAGPLRRCSWLRANSVRGLHSIPPFQNSYYQSCDIFFLASFSKQSVHVHCVSGCPHSHKSYI